MPARATDTILLDLLNDAAAALIDIDPDGKRNLARLRGKVFCIELTAPPVTLYLLPSERGIEFCRSSDAPPDVTLSGSAPAFARLGGGFGGGGGARASGGLNQSNQSKVTMRGDAELGRALQQILSDLDLDWEELLARRIGDTPARKVGNALRELAEWAEKSAGLTRENAADYLTEETRVLVTAAAVERFEEALDQTRADVDRLAQRVERLQRARGETATRPRTNENDQ